MDIAHHLPSPQNILTIEQMEEWPSHTRKPWSFADLYMSSSEAADSGPTRGHRVCAPHAYKWADALGRIPSKLKYEEATDVLRQGLKCEPFFSILFV